MATTAFQLLGTIKLTGLDEARRGLENLKDSVKNVGHGLNQMSTAMLSAGGAITGAFVGAGLKFASVSDTIDKMSIRTGIAVDELQTLTYAAKLSGISFGTLETAIKLMHRNLDNAKAGMGQAAQALATLGIDINEIISLSPVEQFKRLANAISTIPDPGTRAALAMDLFGRSGAELLPLLMIGAAGIDQMGEKLKQLGFYLDETSIKAGTELNNALDTLKTGWTVTIAKLGEQAGLSSLINGLIEVVSTINKWISANPELVRTIRDVGIALVVLGGAIKAINVALAIMHALSGIGVAKLLASLAMAGAAIAGIHALETMGAKKIPMEIPEMQYGGIIRRPTLVLAGESGAEAILPLSQLGKYISGPTVLNIHVGNFMGDDLSLRQFVRTVQRILREENRRSTFEHTRTTYYSVSKHL